MPEFLPEIKVIDGELIEGNTIELLADFTGDIISNLHPYKKWTVFAEKNIKYDTVEEKYFYEEDKGTLYEAYDQDNIQILNLIPGRLFCRFEYTDFYNNDKETSFVFTVLPQTDIRYDEDLVEGQIGEFSSILNIENVGVEWTFGDDGSILSGTNVSKQFDIEGYHDINTRFDFTTSEYQDGSHIVWASEPDDKLAFISLGFFGNEIALDPGGTMGESISAANVPVSSITSDISGTDTSSISGQMLVRTDLDDLIDLDVQFSKSVDGTIDAPLQIVFDDKSVYSIEVGGEGIDQIQFTELDFGDGNSIKSTDLDFVFTKLYQRSGVYNGVYRINTIHYRDGGPPYKQIKEFEFTVTVDPFFTKWWKDHFPTNIYNSEGFKDLASAWGVQMDRLYNETQVLLDSIDIEQIDNKFLAHYAATYGDFPEVYERVGFSGFAENIGERFNQFVTYNFFDRLEGGNLLPQEKQEFINYIQSSKNRLRTKGTPVSIERAIAQFFLDAKVVELWTDSFEVKAFVPITDEVFGGDSISNNTGIRVRALSTPTSDNENNTYLNSNQNSYIEINTVNRNDIQYYTSTSQTEIIDGVEYVVFDKT
jgi:hypothetical protein